MKLQPVRTFSQLLERAQKEKTKKVAIVCAENDIALKALASAVAKKIARPVLIGDENNIREKISALDLTAELSTATFFQARTVEQAAEYAVALGRNGKVDILLKGNLRTDQLLRAVLHKEKGLRRGELLSDILLYEDKCSGKTRLVGITDGGLTPQPNLQQKIALIRNAVPVMQALGISRPKMGLMSATESISEAVPSTVDAQKITEKAGELFTDCDVFGPLALDNALLKSAAEAKGISSPVAGAVDCMIAPNIEAANMTAKAVKYIGGSTCAHVIMGAQIPVLIPSRVESAEDKLYAIALGVLIDAD
ncbi:MAG: phosphate butyryltransferase [Calditrichaeota bacterium]|nr:MAG: phosphate butyryltransferase [Calditrichota bacterium]